MYGSMKKLLVFFCMLFDATACEHKLLQNHSFSNDYFIKIKKKVKNNSFSYCAVCLDVRGE